jgi:beta-lactamase class A
MIPSGIDISNLSVFRPAHRRNIMVDILVTDLNKLCDELPFHTGWYLKALRTGETAHRHGHVVVPSASTRKIAVMMTALKAVYEGQLALDQPVTIQAKYQNNDSGCFQYLQPGFTIQLRDVLVMMIIVSDNTCTGTVVDMVGLDAINALSQSVGMQGTTHRYGIPPAGMAGYRPAPETNATTPADVGLLLERILQGSQDPAVAAQLGSTPALCQLALDILSWQRMRNRLPARLPLGTKVAHKTGTTARNYNDAGIIYQGDQPLFILSAYTDEVPLDLPDGTPGHTAAHHLIAQMSRLCYDALRV